MSEDVRKCIPFDSYHDIKVPAGTRLFMILGEPVVVPGDDGTTRIYVHPDDIEIVKAANPSEVPPS